MIPSTRNNNNVTMVLLSYLLLLLSWPTSSTAQLQVIGSGFGRTGTDTLREALNELGYKTYHMKEIIEHGFISHVNFWKQQAENNCADVEGMKSLFEEGGWTAAVDFPSCLCWETLMKAYPHAKIVHTERESSERWWDSASNTIIGIGAKFPFNLIQMVSPFFRAHRSMSDSMWTRVAGKTVSSQHSGYPQVYKEDLIKGYEKNNARVRTKVGKEQLLIQDHRKGWKELCQFLGKKVPNRPYPHRNTRGEFISWVQRIAASMILVFGVILTVVIGVGYIVLGRGRKQERGVGNKSKGE
jgi:hypothetical protein